MVTKIEWPEPKDPVEVLDYTVDWAARLEDDETISSVEWTLPNSGAPTQAPQGASTDGANATIWLEGGSPGSYDIGCKMTTSEGRVHQIDVRLGVRE